MLNVGIGVLILYNFTQLAEYGTQFFLPQNSLHPNPQYFGELGSAIFFSSGYAFCTLKGQSHEINVWFVWAQ